MREFHGGLMLRTPNFHSRGHEIPGKGTKILQTALHSLPSKLKIIIIIK